MKSRDGFISNSSTTSFILAFEDRDKCPTCGRSDYDLIELIEKSNGYSDDRTHINAQSPENVIEYIQKVWQDWYIDPEMDVKIMKFMSEHDGWQVIACEVSYHDDAINKIINEKEENKTLVKLWSDHED